VFGFATEQEVKSRFDFVKSIDFSFYSNDPKPVDEKRITILNYYVSDKPAVLVEGELANKGFLSINNITILGSKSPYILLVKLDLSKISNLSNADKMQGKIILQYPSGPLVPWPKSEQTKEITVTVSILPDIVVATSAAFREIKDPSLQAYLAELSQIEDSLNQDPSNYALQKKYVLAVSNLYEAIAKAGKVKFDSAAFKKQLALVLHRKNALRVLELEKQNISFTKSYLDSVANTEFKRPNWKAYWNQLNGLKLLTDAGRIAMTGKNSTEIITTTLPAEAAKLSEINLGITLIQKYLLKGKSLILIKTGEGLPEKERGFIAAAWQDPVVQAQYNLESLIMQKTFLEPADFEGVAYYVVIGRDD